MIQVSHLKKTYSNGLQVLRDVNATIEKGEVISIIGPSGTGKSTFLRCLNLLEKPTGGSIIVDGQDLLSKRTDVPKLRQKMGMVFQSFNLFNHLSIMDNLCIGPVKLLGKSRKEAEERAMELLAMVGLAEKAHVSPMAITNYEKGDRKPSMEILQALADALEVRVSDFLAIRNENICFIHGEFRKNSTLSLSQQEHLGTVYLCGVITDVT